MSYNEELIQQLRSGNKGVLITKVGSDSFGARAGLVRGDILYEFGATPVNTPNEVRKAVNSFEPGDQIVLLFLHGDELKQTSTEYPTAFTYFLASASSCLEG